MVLAPGTPFGPYRILGRLGSGGMASVYHAFQAAPAREVALKVINADLAQQPAFRARFRREADVLARLEHPNILPIFEMGEIDGQAYLRYRYIRGGTLRDVLDGPLPVAEAIALLSPVADALDFAHAQGVVHRDIKPANILLTPPDGRGRRTPIVADFGIARLLEPALVGGDATQTLTGDSAALTQLGVGLGTPAYMAPEQVLGRPLDGRADQYALAITAYQLLTGAVPFSATTPVEVAFMHVNEPLPLPSSRNPAIIPALEQALLKALAKHPEDRYASCGDFISSLAEAETLPAPPAPSAEPPPTSAVTPPATDEPVTVPEPVTAPVRPSTNVRASTALVEPASAPPPSRMPAHTDQPPTVMVRPQPAPQLPPARSRTRLVAGLAAGVVILVGAGIAIAVLASHSGAKPTPIPTVAHAGPGTVTATNRATSPSGTAVRVTSSTVTTVAGSGEGFADGPASAAQFDGPGGIAIDNRGNLYIADEGNNRIRMLSPAGQVTTLAGSGTKGFSDGDGATAQFCFPSGVAVASDGTVYVADSGNSRVRKVSQEGRVTTLAGSGTAGFADGVGSAAQFDGPHGIAVDGTGTVYVADTRNNRIRKITPEGQVTTVAGTGAAGFADGPGAAAQFAAPHGIAMDSRGILYVADTENNRIRTITPEGTVATLAGSGTQGSTDAPRLLAAFYNPSGIAVARDGTVYVADTLNNCIRTITPDGTVTTLAGSAMTTFGFADGDGASAKFEVPAGLLIAPNGDLYVADGGNNRIRRIAPPRTPAPPTPGAH